jgi:hypothetical protein
MATGVRIDSNSTDDIVLGDNYSEATNYLGGALTYASFGLRGGGNFILKDVSDYTKFSQASATPSDAFYLQFPAGIVITDVWWKLDTEFSGGTVSAATLEFGISGGDLDGFLPAENVFTGAAAGYKDSTIASRGELLYDATAGNTMPLHYFITTATNFTATLRLTGDTGDHLTAGQATIWVKGYRVK